MLHSYNTENSKKRKKMLKYRSLLLDCSLWIMFVPFWVVPGKENIKKKDLVSHANKSIFPVPLLDLKPVLLALRIFFILSAPCHFSWKQTVKPCTHYSFLKSVLILLVCQASPTVKHLSLNIEFVSYQFIDTAYIFIALGCEKIHTH